MFARPLGHGGTQPVIDALKTAYGKFLAAFFTCVRDSQATPFPAVASFSTLFLSLPSHQRSAMAKRKHNKSQAIRDILQQNPQATAREAIEQLGAKGMKVSPKLFYLVKGKVSQAATHTRKKAARVAKATARISGMDSIQLIAKVKALAKEAGGIDYLKALVNVLAD